MAFNFSDADYVWIGTSGNTYALYKQALSWSAAAQFAQSHGGFLAKVEGLEENQEIFSNISARLSANDFDRTRAPDGGGAAYIWLGASDQAIEGQWTWSDGSGLSISRVEWGRGSLGSEPDNYNDQDFLALGLQNWPKGSTTDQGYGNAGQWNDVSGKNALFFVVEASSASIGTDKPDNLVGTTGNDNISGRAGNDNVFGDIGNNLLDGGLGIDRAIYAGKMSDYQITISEVGINLSGLGTNDVLKNFERLKFSDETIAFDLNGNAGQAYRLYKAALNRTPDEKGLGGWIGLIDNGMPLSDAARGFVDSTEFSTKYGTLDNRAFVNRLYNNVLGRDGEPKGIDDWVAWMGQGHSRAEVLVGFSESPENQVNVSGLIRNGIFYTEA